MKKYTLWFLIVVGTMTANPASAWFWEQEEVKAPAAPAEVKEEKGFWAEVMDSSRDFGHDISRYFKELGQETKKATKQMPGEIKKEGKEVGISMKKTGKTLGQEAKKGGKAIGQGFKELGHEVKDAAQSIFDGKPEDSAQDKQEDNGQ
ncbi:MAG: hypothetical protein KKB30_11200 [Proteobacteria bacterium]|nr:hypothetical protein [Pseudomonadota bacterium]MBU1714333.1 hypothetical protein [Pseudomonadota bacterium]